MIKVYLIILLMCRNPFVKFISHSASYIFFLGLLAAASQRIEYLIVEVIGEKQNVIGEFLIVKVFVDD
jgi:hypothetical protein